MSAAVAASAPAADVEKGAAAADTNVDGGGAPAAAGEGVVGAVVRRWRRQDLLEKSGSALRVAAWAFSLLAFVVMGANDHGDWRQFEHYEEYRYVVAIGVLAFIYTTLQLVRHGVRLTGGQDLQGKVAVFVDFAGDQV
uniref:CASP-like protein n=1 Tax=Oryza punctata TaxID=4537 RepID=A0A0E0L196_ORYPU